MKTIFNYKCIYKNNSSILLKHLIKIIEYGCFWEKYLKNPWNCIFFRNTSAWQKCERDLGTWDDIFHPCQSQCSTLEKIYYTHDHFLGTANCYILYGYYIP